MFLKWSRSMKHTATRAFVRRASWTVFLDAVFQQHAVGQAGQRVVQGHVGDVTFLQVSLGDIAQHAPDAEELTVVVAFGDEAAFHPLLVGGLGPSRGSGRGTRPLRPSCRSPRHFRKALRSSAWTASASGAAARGVAGEVPPTAVGAGDAAVGKELQGRPHRACPGYGRRSAAPPPTVFPWPRPG